MIDRTADFNTEAELDTIKKYVNYELTGSEVEQIWSVDKETKDNIHQETNDHYDEKTFSARLDAEYKDLAAKQQPKLEMHLRPDGARGMSSKQELLNAAWDNVIANFDNRIKDIKQEANKKIDVILEKARDDGRYNDPSIDHDPDRDPDRGPNNQPTRDR